MKKYFDDELQDIVGLLDHIAKILCAFPWMFSLLYQRKAKFKVRKSFYIERNRIDDINVEINYAASFSQTSIFGIYVIEYVN